MALKKGKSTDPKENGITYEVLRFYYATAGSLLLNLFNESLEKELLAAEW